ncbi:hypothetical protein MBT84_45735 [Streptomyces sp. MBT84]|nr:hypothetical protein [Streptomyces sp. MBT84]
MRSGNGHRDCSPNGIPEAGVTEERGVATLISVAAWSALKTLGTLIVLKFTTVNLAQGPAGLQGTERSRPRVQKQALSLSFNRGERVGCA